MPQRNYHAYNPLLGYYHNDAGIIMQIRKKFDNFTEQLNKDGAQLDDAITVLTNLRFFLTDLSVHSEEAVLDDTEARLGCLKKGLEELVRNTIFEILTKLEAIEESCLLQPLAAEDF